MTDYLYTPPSFLSGLARSIDIGGAYTRYNFSRDGHDADANAMAADVEAVARLIRDALGQLEQAVEAGQQATQPRLF